MQMNSWPPVWHVEIMGLGSHSHKKTSEKKKNPQNQLILGPSKKSMSGQKHNPEHWRGWTNAGDRSLLGAEAMTAASD